MICSFFVEGKVCDDSKKMLINLASRCQPLVGYYCTQNFVTCGAYELR